MIPTHSCVFTQGWGSVSQQCMRDFLSNPAPSGRDTGNRSAVDTISSGPAACLASLFSNPSPVSFFSLPFFLELQQGQKQCRVRSWRQARDAACLGEAAVS